MPQDEASIIRTNHWFASQVVLVFRRRTVCCANPEVIAFAKPQVAKFGSADSNCVGQHSLEHRLELAWRRTDDLQYLRGCSLLLERLAQLVRACLHLVAQSHGLDGDPR